MPKKYPPEFKRDVVTVARRGDLTVPEVAVDFDVSEESVRRWMRQADIDEGIKDGQTSSEQTELVQLRRDKRRLEMENERRAPRGGLLRRRIAPKMTLLCLASSHRGLKFAKDRATHVALETAADLAVGAAFGPSTDEIVAGGFVVAHPRADDDVERSVELTVS